MNFSAFCKSLILMFFMVCLFTAPSFADDESDSDLTMEDRITNVVSLMEQLPDGAQKKIREEGADIQYRCNDKDLYSQLHNCECIMVRFIELRLKYGPDESRDNILDELSKTCVSSEGAAGYGYQKCHRIYGSSQNDGDERTEEEFCSCFGNKFSKFYQEVPSSDYFHIEKLFTLARQECNFIRR